MESHETIIDMQNVSFTYEGTDKSVLSNVSLRVKQGEWISIVGPSGSGKSTLCSLMSGVLQRMSERVEGSITLFGTDCSSSGLPPDKNGQAGIVFHDPDLGLIQSHVEDELSFAPENLRVAPDEIIQRMKHALDDVGLPQTMMSRRTNELSGGQKQRVAIASILTMKPTLLICDEAAIHLDQQGTKKLYETLRTLNREGHTIVTASSRWEELAEPDHVIVLDQGRIAASGDPKTIRANEADRLRELGIEPIALSEGAVTKGTFDLNERNKWETFVQDESKFGVPVLEVNNLNFSFHHSAAPILENIQFQLPERAFLAVLGENGTGKTTLGRLLVGLLPYEEGQIFIRGRDIRSLSLKQISRSVGYIFQNPDHQFVANTVWEECKFGENNDQIVSEMLEKFELTADKYTNPYQLNLFQKRKLNLLTASLSKPDLIVLDEPTAGLNVAEAKQLVSYCTHIAQQGSAIVMITHDFLAIQADATHALWL